MSMLCGTRRCQCYAGHVDVNVTFTAVLRWRGGGRPTSVVKMLEAGDIVGSAGESFGYFNYYAFPGFLPDETIVDNGMGGTVEFFDDNATRLMRTTLAPVVANRYHRKAFVLPTRTMHLHLAARQDHDTYVNYALASYVYYHVHVLGQKRFAWRKMHHAPPYSGATPEHPGCDDYNPDDGGLPDHPCTTDGAASPDPVNLTTGDESNEPRPDLTIYNPHGMPVVWRRAFGTDLSLNSQQSPGLGTGWSHNYDLSLTVNKAILDESGTVIDDGTDTSEDSDTLDRAPASTTPIPLGMPVTVTLNYPNGASEGLTPLYDSSGDFTGNFQSKTTQYRATGVYDAAAKTFSAITITWNNGTSWLFTLVPGSDGSALRLTGITNRLGQSLAFAWDDNGRLLHVSDGATTTVLLSLTYENDYLSKATDVYGRQVRYTTTNGTLTTVSQVGIADQGTIPWHWQYAYQSPTNDDRVVLSSVTVPSPTGTGTGTATIEYEANTETPRVTALVDANGNRTEFEYLDHATRVRRKDSSGTVLSRYASLYDDHNRTVEIDIEDSGGVVQRSTTMAYNDPVNPYSATLVQKSGLTIQTAYDAYGNVTDVVAPNRTIHYDYLPNDFPFNFLHEVTQTNGAEQTRTVSTFAYNAQHLLNSVTVPSPAGGTMATTFEYDALGNITKVVAPGVTTDKPLITLFDYTSDNGAFVQPALLGQPVAITDPVGRVSHLRYDALGQPQTTTDAAGNTTAYTFNIAGQPDTITLPAANLAQAQGQKIAFAYLYPGAGRTGTTIYDADGSVVRQTYTQYGAEGEVIETGGDTAEPVHYVYDGVGHVVNIRNAAGVDISNYFYTDIGDMWAELQVVTHAGTGYDDTRQRSFSYDDFGNVLQMDEGYPFRANSPTKTIQYTYDPADLLLTGMYSGNDQTHPIATYSYDAWRRLQSVTDPLSTKTYHYDDATDALLSATTQYSGLPAKTIGYSYTPNGQRAGMSTPAGSFTYDYDDAGRLKSLTNPLGETTTWTYDPVRGLLQSQRSANGIVASYVHDALGRVIDLTNTDASGSVLSRFTTPSVGGFDGTGNRLQVTATIPGASSISGVTQWQYDHRNRLTGEVSERAGGWNHTHSYDDAGNLTTLRNQNQAFDWQNQLLSFTNDASGNFVYEGSLFDYDERGNPTTYNGTSLTFNDLSHLTAFDNPGIFAADYSSDGLRAWKVAPEAGTPQTYYLYDGTVPIIELGADGTSIYAVNMFGADGLISRKDNLGAGTDIGAFGVSRFYTFDERGNVSDAAFDGGYYHTAAPNVYDAYGSLLWGGNDTFAFGGKYGYRTDTYISALTSATVYTTCLEEAFPLAEAAQAHDPSQYGHIRGKIVLTAD